MVETEGDSTHEKELFKLDVSTNFDADRRFDENKCFQILISQRQIKFLLQNLSVLIHHQFYRQTTARVGQNAFNA